MMEINVPRKRGRNAFCRHPSPVRAASQRRHANIPRVYTRHVPYVALPGWRFFNDGLNNTRRTTIFLVYKHFKAIC